MLGSVGQSPCCDVVLYILSDLLKGRNNEVTKVANYMKLFEKIKREIQLLEAGEGPTINGDWEIKDK